MARGEERRLHSPGGFALTGSEGRIMGRATSARSLASSGFFLAEFFLKQLSLLSRKRKAEFLRPDRVLGRPGVQALAQIHFGQIAVCRSMIRIDVQHLAECSGGHLELAPL